MKREPQNVEAALSHTIKLESFEQSLSCKGTLINHDNGCSKRRSQTVYAVAELSDASENAVFCKPVDELQQVLVQVTKGIAALAAGSRSG